MEIKYKSKSNINGIGIEIRFDEKVETEQVNTLLEELGKEFPKQSRYNGITSLPASFTVDKKRVASFHAIGSRPFGIFTQDEAIDFVDRTLPILKKYDKTIKRKFTQYAEE